MTPFRPGDLSGESRAGPDGRGDRSMNPDEHFVRVSRLYDAEGGDSREFEWRDR
ncbi:MAG: hypothetical protein ACOCR6_02315 [archaeon]